jgi:hypothetical protein
MDQKNKNQKFRPSKNRRRKEFHSLLHLPPLQQQLIA